MIRPIPSTISSSLVAYEKRRYPDGPKASPGTAAIAALTGNLDAVHKMGEAFNRRRKLIVDLLNEIPGFECPTPTGAFYVYPSVKGVLGKTIRGKTPTTSAELATLLLEEVEVAAVPGEAFGPSGYLRFSYFMAFNRAAMIEVGGFNPRALYYRNADIEYSLKIRQAGGRLLQMELPLIQDRHHGYHDADPEYREVQSKKNYDRILDKYRGKSAILSPRR